ncbi:MAG: hypothetical protein Q9182_004330 [Xanthomendoza sp. 2 TL-2023]
MTTREASHAGSWYTDDDMPDILTPAPPPPTPTNVLISRDGISLPFPHSVSHLLTAKRNSKRIFLLGPSHHLYLPTLALPSPALQSYSTPLGPIPLDIPTLNALRSTNQFDTLNLDDDEAEHSLEMHLPYIRHLFSHSHPSSSADNNNNNNPPPLTPILIGSTNPSTERKYGALLAPYLADPHTIFIVSSDFCHWGLRFNYTFYIPSTTATPGITLTKSSNPRPKDPPIHQSIAHIDHACMKAISTGSHEAFLHVLRETGNTVCGRHPIGVVMAALEVLRGEQEEEGEGKGRFRFVRYERSSEVESVGESSVSYASAFAVV